MRLHHHHRAIVCDLIGDRIAGWRTLGYLVAGNWRAVRTEEKGEGSMQAGLTS